jgi:hypothetical protein
MKSVFTDAGRAVEPDPRVRLGAWPRSPAARHIAHVGYHKTASTWLQRCVFPRLAGVRYGDPRVRHLLANLANAPNEAFFASEIGSVLRQSERLDGEPLLLSDEGISGSLWDGYGTGPRNAERLSRVLPTGRILVLVRRQDHMLRSIHGQYVNEGGTRSLGDFLSGQPIEGSRLSLQHLEYDRLVRRYVELFGRDQVRVMPYEYLRARPVPFLHELCEFLGATLRGRVSATRHNRSLSPPSLRLLRSWNRCFRVSRFNQEPLVRALPGGRRMRNLLQRRVDPIVRNVIGRGLPREDAATLADIAAGFSGSNRRLQQFCAYPLTEWGYLLPSVSAPAVAGATLLARTFEPAPAD